MCGLFACTLTRPPDPELIRAAAAAAARRGPHGHGYGTPWSTPHRQPGPLNPDDESLTAYRILIGHCRLATVGGHDDTALLGPAGNTGSLLAHNGHIRNWRDLDPNAAGDSAALLTRYRHHRNRHDAAAALEQALAEADQHAYALLLLEPDGTVLAARHELPLLRLDTEHGTYLSSGRFHPDAQPIGEQTVLTLAPT